MASVIYKSPFLYKTALRILHGGALAKRYKLISTEIGAGMRVFDVGCGTCELAAFLDRSCISTGIDLNEKFVGHARSRGLDVVIGDVLDEGNYPDDLDMIVLSDILHHVVPKHDELVDLCKSKAEKVIICEPFAKHHRGALKGLHSMKFLHNIFGDWDGINDFDDMKQWNIYGKDNLVRLFKGYGIGKMHLIGDNIVGVWSRKD